MIDIATTINGSRPTYGGVTFASKPAALRQLQMVREIETHLGDTPGAVGLEVGAKSVEPSTLLDAFGIRCVRLDVQDREDRRGLILGDGGQLPFRTACLDYVVASNVLAHVDDVEAAHPEGGSPSIAKPGLAGRWPLPLVLLTAPFHSIALKSLEIAIRAVLKAKWEPPTGEGDKHPESYSGWEGQG